MSHVDSVSKAKAQLDISGIFPPITTPFNDKEDIDYEKLRSNLSRWNKMPFAGKIGVFDYSCYSSRL